MTMKINLLNVDHKAEATREDAILFVTAIVGMIAGAIISAIIVVLT